MKFHQMNTLAKIEKIFADLDTTPDHPKNILELDARRADLDKFLFDKPATPQQILAQGGTLTAAKKAALDHAARAAMFDLGGSEGLHHEMRNLINANIGTYAEQLIAAATNAANELHTAAQHIPTDRANWEDGTDWNRAAREGYTNHLAAATNAATTLVTYSRLFAAAGTKHQIAAVIDTPHTKFPPIIVMRGQVNNPTEQVAEIMAARNIGQNKPHANMLTHIAAGGRPGFTINPTADLDEIERRIRVLESANRTENHG